MSSSFEVLNQINTSVTFDPRSFRSISGIIFNGKLSDVANIGVSRVQLGTAIDAEHLVVAQRYSTDKAYLEAEFLLTEAKYTALTDDDVLELSILGSLTLLSGLLNSPVGVVDVMTNAKNELTAAVPEGEILVLQKSDFVIDFIGGYYVATKSFTYKLPSFDTGRVNGIAGSNTTVSRYSALYAKTVNAFDANVRVSLYFKK